MPFNADWNPFKESNPTTRFRHAGSSQTFPHASSYDSDADVDFNMEKVDVQQPKAAPEGYQTSSTLNTATPVQSTNPFRKIMTPEEHQTSAGVCLVRQPTEENMNALLYALNAKEEELKVVKTQK